MAATTSPGTTVTPVWTGTWVEQRLGVALPDAQVRELVGLALRRNPRRAHLLVSQVLGKHVPQRPETVHGAGFALGRQVRELLGGAEAARAVVLGYAETATALGHCVADGLGGVAYLHSTRRQVPGAVPVGGFEEEHSHATSHLLLPERADFLAGDGPLVLVDDEFSTGRTVVNTLTALHARYPRPHYVVATLVDLRGEEDRERLRKTAADLGARIDVVAAVSARIGLPDDVLERGAALVAAEERRAPAPRTDDRAPAGLLSRCRLAWPEGLKDGGRHGFEAADHARLAAVLPDLGRQLARTLDACGDARAVGGRVLVLGTEELMYAPLRLAGALQQVLEEERAGEVEVRFSSTTRSPVLAVDDPGYAVRTRLCFPAHDHPADGEGLRYAYNVAPGADPARRFDAVLVVVDDEGDRAELHLPGRGLIDRLRAVTDRVVLAVLPSYRPRPVAVPAAVPAAREASEELDVLPSPLYGPEFSSYPADEVAWLLKDLSDVPLEAPVEEREEAVQNAGAHYAESLPIEYQPSAEYQELYRVALAESARRVAHAVGVVTETVLAERGRGAVLASLARAGTPVGVLMRRWAAAVHGLELPHYAVSIVRGRGIDQVALRYLAARHRAEDVVFVDGWTGKGAITRELTAALAGTGFSPELAVLADPGRSVRTYGTREDYLIPSACLNSTVSGLISRTVLRADLIGPDEFHGAKFYRELAGADVSVGFLDAVAAHFAEVREAAQADAAALLAAPEAERAPDWSGWAAVERISEEYGIGSVNLVKPGVGETTRVMLRRVPWRVLVRPGAEAELKHVLLLAEQRGVPVEPREDLPYSCMGLIHPRYQRGATGEEGTAL